MNSSVPVSVKGVSGVGTLAGVQKISAGYSHTCAIVANGSVVCWGANIVGELGDGTAQQSAVPVQVLGQNGNGILSNVVDISAGTYFTCVVTSDKHAYCWGAGPGASGAQSVPALVLADGSTPFTDAVEVSSGKSHVCFRKADATVWCMGENIAGSLGNGTSSLGTVDYPTKVTDGGLVDFSAKGLPSGQGFGHTCVWRDGVVFCWGDASSGEVGGTGSDVCELSKPCEKKPVNVSGLLGTSTALGVGQDHACSIETGGEVRCWGYNGDGQVGMAASDTCNTHPCSRKAVPVTCQGSALTASRLAVGGDHACAVTTTGIKCWGRNLSGELGNGATANSACPVSVIGL